MTSSPPGARQPIQGCARLRDLASLEEGVIFFSVEGAPPQACRTQTARDGSIRFLTSLSGLLTQVRLDELVLQVGPAPVIVRHLLPRAVDLSDLVGQRLVLRIEQRYRGPGRATIDAEFHDRTGRLLLWAHDGRFPEDRQAHGLAVRASLDSAQRHRLAIVHQRGVTTLAAPGRGRIEHEGVNFDVAVIRLGADDVSFVALRNH